MFVCSEIPKMSYVDFDDSKVVFLISLFVRFINSHPFSVAQGFDSLHNLELTLKRLLQAWQGDKNILLFPTLYFISAGK